MKVEKIIRNIQRNKLETDEYKLTLLSNEKFHIDCLILSTILKSKYSEMGIIELLQDDKEVLLIFDEALENYKKIVQSYAEMKKESVSVALRKADLDKRIIRFINKK